MPVGLAKDKIAKNLLPLLLILLTLLLVACGEDPTVPPAATTSAPTTVTSASTTTLAATTTTAAIATTTTAAPVATNAPATTTAPAAAPTAPAAPAGDPAKGKAAFMNQGCVACHGPNAQGAYGPKIAGTQLPFPRFLSQIRNPVNPDPAKAMTPFDPATLPDSQAADIYAFLQTLK